PAATGPMSSIPHPYPEAIPNFRHHGFSFRGSRRSLLLPDPGHEPRGEEERESIRRHRERIAGRLNEQTREDRPCDLSRRIGGLAFAVSLHDLATWHKRGAVRLDMVTG